MRSVRTLAAAALLLLPAYHVASAAEPKQGGILKVYHRDSPASASIHEERDLFDQHSLHAGFQ